MLRVSLTPMYSAISSIMPNTIAMPSRTPAKMPVFVPSVPNRTLYSMDAREPTTMAPVSSFPDFQSSALNSDHQLNSGSKLLVAGDTRPASTFCGAWLTSVPEIVTFDLAPPRSMVTDSGEVFAVGAFLLDVGANGKDFSGIGHHRPGRRKIEGHD